MPFGLNSLAIAPVTTRRYELPIELEPGKPWTLHLRHAGESNAAFWNAQLKIVNQTMNKGVTGKTRITPERIALVRTEWAQLAGQHVLVGWENVLEDGEPAACTPDAAQRFLAELLANAPDLFDAVRRFASDAEEFRGELADAVAVGKS